jgi:hypothetical protein
MSTEESVLERLNALEKQNRRMKQIGVAVIMIAASLLVMAQKQPTNRTVEANEFVLRDSSGDVRSKWSMTQEGPRLSLLDSEGKERVGVYCRDAFGRGGITFLDPNSGTPSSMFPNSMFLIGPSGKSGPGIYMTQAGSFINLGTSQEKSQNPFIEIADKEGFRATLGSTDLGTERTGETHQTSAASVILFGKDKKVLWKAP